MNKRPLMIYIEQRLRLAGTHKPRNAAVEATKAGDRIGFSHAIWKPVVTVFFIVAFSSLTPPSSAYARSEGQEGHGGDVAVAIFLGVAQVFDRCLEANPASWSALPLLLEEYRSAIARTEVHSVERTILNGDEVDAINYPDMNAPRILINRDRWLDQRLGTDLRAVLVMHEFLSIMGYQDSRYTISYPLAARNKKCLLQEN